MKTLSPKTWLLSLAALSTCFTTAAHAQGWETVFTLPPPADGRADRAPVVILPDPSTYTYRVLAFNVAGGSPYSNHVSVKTK